MFVVPYKPPLPPEPQREQQLIKTDSTRGLGASFGAVGGGCVRKGVWGVCFGEVVWGLFLAGLFWVGRFGVFFIEELFSGGF